MFYNFKFNSENQRLDEFLRQKLPEAVDSSRSLSEHSAINISNSKIRRLILAGVVQVNGKIVRRPAFELRGRSTVDVNFDPQRFFYEKQPDDVAFEMTDEAVLYEDENLIFVNKPADFPVEQTVTGNRVNLHDVVVDYLWKRNPALRNPPYVGIMHRLDRTTSGVIVFTKNRAVNKEMSELFQKHGLTKRYFAVVEEPYGGMDDGKGFSVEMFMGRIAGKSQQGRWGELPESRGGQYSKTDFTVSRHLKVEGRPCLLIECTLYTGRTHQIRVHLAGRGLPILGDTLYGGAEALRLYLHAAHLSFTLNGSSYDVKSPFTGL